MAVEVHGSSLKNVLDGCGVFQRRVRAMLDEKGITNIDSDGWYDLEQVQGVINDLASSVGENLLVEIGKYVPINSTFPPEIDTFVKALHSLNVAYQMNHRNGNIGKYEIVEESANVFKLICDTPAYPAKFNQGLIKGLAKKYNTLIRMEDLNMTGGGEFRITVR